MRDAPPDPFASCLAFVLRAEGGYVCDPDDPGGATNFGITQKTYDQWTKDRMVASGDVKLITQDEVREIYKTNYWIAAGCPDLEWPMNLIAFDTAVNQGVSMARQVMRAATGLGPDAAIGIRRYIYRRLADSNATFKKFIVGWINRTEALRRFYA